MQVKLEESRFVVCKSDLALICFTVIPGSRLFSHFPVAPTLKEGRETPDLRPKAAPLQSDRHWNPVPPASWILAPGSSLFFASICFDLRSFFPNPRSVLDWCPFAVENVSTLRHFRPTVIGILGSFAPDKIRVRN